MASWCEPTPHQSPPQRPSVARRTSKEHKQDGEASHSRHQEDPERLAELYFLASVQPGEWPKAGEVARILNKRRNDRESCRAAAKAAEGVAAHERGLDALVEQGAIQQLAEVWQVHRTDTALAVHVSNVVARFWERAGGDEQWFMLAAPLAVGKALLAAGRAEWLSEAHRAAVRLHEKGNSAAALDIYRLAIEQFQKSVGPADECTLQAQNNMAVLLEERGQLEDAARMHQEVGEKLEAKNGPDHPDTMSSKFNQAALKMKQGRMSDAEALYRQVTEQRERVLGGQNPDTLRAKGNLAELLRKQGRLPEAENLLKVIVDSRHASLGRDDSGTLKSRCQLALVLAQQGDPEKLRQAEAHLREVVARREQGLGRGHPDTLVALSRLAFLLEEKRPDEAEQLNEQVWQWLDAAAPLEKRRARMRLGGLTSSLEDDSSSPTNRAEAMLRQVVERRRSTLGAGHPDAIAARAELAVQLVRRGTTETLAEALSLQREVSELCEATLGAHHVDTLAARAALAGTILRRADVQGGEEATLMRAEAETLHIETSARFGHVVVGGPSVSGGLAAPEGSSAGAAGTSEVGPRTPSGTKHAVLLRGGK
mmetsp:Transcript_76052/g.163261  ORF Transcript_76052/g.163261 Transcript_76052/m.163261 type:complete len:596 (-) Transcript_76052:167-1954(-)